METYSLQLTRELAKLADLTVFSLPGQNNGKSFDWIKLIIFILHCFKSMTFNKTFEVVHIGDFVLWPLAWFAKLTNPKIQIFITAYGLDIVYGKKSGILPAIYKYYLALGVKLCSNYLNVIAISSTTAELCAKAGLIKTNVIYLGVNIISKQDIKPSKFISSPYLLYVGRLVKRKGCGWFIENVLPNLEDDIRLVVVGKLWDTEEMKIIKNNPRVIYESYLADEDLSALREGALAVVMPNINSRGVDFEGFGLTALEAAADGGVLLASRIDGIVDAVIDGETGFLIQPENTFEWVNKINEVKSWSKSYKLNFIKKAKSRLKADYSWCRVAQKTFDLYKTSGEKL